MTWIARETQDKQVFAKSLWWKNGCFFYSCFIPLSFTELSPYSGILSLTSFDNICGMVKFSVTLLLTKLQACYSLPLLKKLSLPHKSFMNAAVIFVLYCQENICE